jgi:hypothetical protein
MRPLMIRRVFHRLPPARSSSSLADEHLFLPISGRWLWGERHKKQQHAKTFNVSALKEVVVKITESESLSRTFPALLKGHNEVFGPPCHRSCQPEYSSSPSAVALERSRPGTLFDQGFLDSAYDTGLGVGVRKWDHPIIEDPKPYPFVSVVQRFRWTQATDPRDKIYAFMGIAKESLRLPKYEIERGRSRVP